LFRAPPLQPDLHREVPPSRRSQRNHLRTTMATADQEQRLSTCNTSPESAPPQQHRAASVFSAPRRTIAQHHQLVAIPSPLHLCNARATSASPSSFARHHCSNNSTIFIHACTCETQSRHLHRVSTAPAPAAMAAFMNL